jgi:cytochrome oxidase Cu insertion factor (SCO1/SenC/PrrC family)
MRFFHALRTAPVLVFVGMVGCLPSRAQSPAPISREGATWTDERGMAVDLERYRGAPVVFSAFFTSCTVRCPLTIRKLREVDEAFRKRGSSAPIVLVTLDPHTDTTGRLLRFKEERHLPDNWHLLRGGDEETRAFARYLHVDPAYDSGHIDHEVRIDVFDANGGLARSFAGWSFDPDGAVVQ